MCLGTNRSEVEMSQHEVVINAFFLWLLECRRTLVPVLCGLWSDEYFFKLAGEILVSTCKVHFFPE